MIDYRVRKTRCVGAAVVELAIVLPLFVLIVLATVEATTMIFLQQSLKISAYEATRVALIPGSNTGNVVAAADLILASRNVDNATTTISPSDFDTQPYGTEITVSVAAPCDDNSLFAPWFYAGKTFTGNVTMMKEY